MRTIDVARYRGSFAYMLRTERGMSIKEIGAVMRAKGPEEVRMWIARGRRLALLEKSRYQIMAEDCRGQLPEDCL